MELHIKSDKNPLKSADFRHGSSKERSEVLRSWWWIGHRRSQIWKVPKCQQVEASNPRGGAPFWIFEGKWEDQRASERVCALSLLLFWRASPILLAPSSVPSLLLCVLYAAANSMIHFMTSAYCFEPSSQQRGEVAMESTVIYFVMRSRFPEVCSCCSRTVLPGPAWVLLSYVSH